MYKLYDEIVESYHLDNVYTIKDVVYGLVWSEIEYVEVETLPSHSRYENTANGVDIYYCYGTDSYFFVESEEV